MILTKRKLIGLLNQCWLDGEKNLEVRYAGNTLFTATLDKKILIRHIPREEQYPFKETSEMPNYEDFMVTFWASNVLKWENQEQILDRILKEANRHPFTADRKLYLSFDSCALRHRSNAVIRKLLNQNKLYIGVVMATGVRQELEGWGQKYKNVETLKNVYGSQRFLGQPTLSARKMKIGYTEYKDILKSTYTNEISSEKGDENIIRKLNDYKKEKDIDLLMISEDKDVEELAKDNKMIAIKIKQQQKLPLRLECEWEEFTDWIYTAAVIFGIIKLGKHHIYGIYNKKNWDKQEINIE